MIPGKTRGLPEFGNTKLGKSFIGSKMNPEYYKDIKNRYGAPLDEPDLEAKQDTYRRERCLEMTGRVISQRGLVGALVLEYLGRFNDNDLFKIRLQDGSIVEGSWTMFFGYGKDPAGVTSNGWYVGDVVPNLEEDIPF